MLLFCVADDGCKLAAVEPLKVKLCDYERSSNDVNAMTHTLRIIRLKQIQSLIVYHTTRLTLHVYTFDPLSKTYFFC